jgi:hypothetical protein
MIGTCEIETTERFGEEMVEPFDDGRVESCDGSCDAGIIKSCGAESVEVCAVELVESCGGALDESCVAKKVEPGDVGRSESEPVDIESINPCGVDEEELMVYIKSTDDNR